MFLGDFFTIVEWVLIGYMFLGCIISLFIVYNEIFWTVPKTNLKDIKNEMKNPMPDLTDAHFNEFHVTIYKEKKYSRVIVIPNFFQIVSKNLRCNQTAIFNFVVMFIVLILRLIVALKLSQIRISTSDYVNILQHYELTRLNKIIDGINTILIFFSLFYYSSLMAPFLKKISTFFISIAKEIINLLFLFLFLIFVFSVLFFSFYEKKIWQLMDFTNVFISTMNLSMGNTLLNENDDLISEGGSGYYYFVSISFLTISSS